MDPGPSRTCIHSWHRNLRPCSRCSTSHVAVPSCSSPQLCSMSRLPGRLWCSLDHSNQRLPSRLHCRSCLAQGPCSLRSYNKQKYRQGTGQQHLSLQSEELHASATLSSNARHYTRRYNAWSDVQRGPLPADVLKCCCTVSVLQVQIRRKCCVAGAGSTQHLYGGHCRASLRGSAQFSIFSNTFIVLQNNSRQSLKPE